MGYHGSKPLRTGFDDAIHRVGEALAGVAGRLGSMLPAVVTSR